MNVTLSLYEPELDIMVYDESADRSVTIAVMGDELTSSERKYYAELIVKAVNSHDTLVAEATELLKNTTWDEDSVGYARVLTQDIEALNAVLEQVK